MKTHAQPYDVPQRGNAMPVEVVFTPRAVEDISDAFEYIADTLGDPYAAERQATAIADKTELLADFPKMGSLIDTQTGIRTEYRRLLCGSYSVFYRFNDNVVRVIRVLHNSRDHIRVLFG